MNTRHVTICAGAAAAALAVLITAVFLKPGPRHLPVPSAVPMPEPKIQTPVELMEPSMPGARKQKGRTRGLDQTPADRPMPSDMAMEDARPDTSGEAGVEALKRRIYDIQVEYIDDLPLLDDLVQDSAREPLPLWTGEWVSIDDWKRYDDVFSVENEGEDRFTLSPERGGINPYQYDPATGEFVREVDYYGKTLIHKAKFISDSVMVRMKISGAKVALDIYTRTRPPE